MHFPSYQHKNILDLTKLLNLSLSLSHIYIYIYNLWPMGYSIESQIQQKGEKNTSQYYIY